MVSVMGGIFKMALLLHSINMICHVRSSCRLQTLLLVPSKAPMVRHTYHCLPGTKADLVAKLGYYLIKIIPAGVKWILGTWRNPCWGDFEPSSGKQCGVKVHMDWAVDSEIFSRWLHCRSKVFRKVPHAAAVFRKSNILVGVDQSINSANPLYFAYKLKDQKAFFDHTRSERLRRTKIL